MATIEASRTEANLQLALATETLASRRYSAYAARADAEGNSQAAALFRVIAGRRSRHAEGHLETLEPRGQESAGLPTGNTTYDVRSAIMHEVHGCSDRYPGMARKARDEGLEEIAGWFEILAKASRSHAGRFRRALETML